MEDDNDSPIQSDFYNWLRSNEFELTEQSRAELWERRYDDRFSSLVSVFLKFINDSFSYECMRVPESLPRWLKCVKWSNREHILEAYKVVETWPTKNLDPLMTALELLDVDYPDPFVRFSAVRLLDTRIDDDRLLPVILQIVQVKRK